jgi:hypothetical protein
VNRGFSFESALFDGMMHLKEGKKNILVGGADEMSQHYFDVTKKALVEERSYKKYGFIGIRE